MLHRYVEELEPDERETLHIHLEKEYMLRSRRKKLQRQCGFLATWNKAKRWRQKANDKRMEICHKGGQSS
jgi:hypothetical protein